MQFFLSFFKYNIKEVFYIGLMFITILDQNLYLIYWPKKTKTFNQVIVSFKTYKKIIYIVFVQI